MNMYMALDFFAKFSENKVHVYKFCFLPLLGHSITQVCGHGLFMENIPPLNGFNGSSGFRRNTPSLRNQPSVFTG